MKAGKDKKRKKSQNGRAHPPVSPEGSRSRATGEPEKIVLVGTYRAAQMKNWILPKGYYNYPVGKDDDCSPERCKLVKELWLYRGKSDRKVFAAEFIGVKTRAQLPDYPAAKEKPHGEKYLLFKVSELYGPELEDAMVHVRVSDFAKRTPKIAAAVKAFQEGSKANPKTPKHLQTLGAAGILAEILPAEIAEVPPERLCIREGALQLDFFALLGNAAKPDVPFPPVENPKFTFIDLFAGIGGFRLAMQAYGGKCVFSSEWDDAAQRTYCANYGDVPCGDITKREVKDLIPARFDVLCAGFPCQPFSLAGVSARNALNQLSGFQHPTQGTLFFDIVQIVHEHKPKVVFLENVRNLMAHDEGRTFKVIKDSIEAEGYSFNPMVIDASPLVPQKRLRCYMVCVRGKGKFEFPRINGPEKKLKTILEDNPSPEYTISDGLWAGHQRRTMRNLARGTGFTAFTADLEKPAHTLVARYYKDGKECLIPQKGKNPRLLTPRECARLQGFPEEFVLPTIRSVAYKQMGNSVAVPVLKRIAECIYNQILKGA